jgi:hypothetical protein
LSSIFFKGRLSSWVKIRVHTKNQLPRLPGSALKVPGGGWDGVWLPTHYKVKLQLQLRLSWAVTTTIITTQPKYFRSIYQNK